MVKDRLPALVALALLTEVVTNVACARVWGDGPLVGGPTFATFGGCIFVGLAALWIGRTDRLALPSSWTRWLPLFPAVATMISLRLRHLLLPGPLLFCGVTAAVGALVMVLSVALPRSAAPMRTRLVLGAAIVSGLALRFFELTLVPIDPARGDMLPLVLLAGRNALAGHSPYAVYHFPWAVPLTYLPLGWLAYAPLFLTSLDPRWASALAELAVRGAIVFAGRRPDSRTARDAAIVLWSAWFISSRLVTYDGVCAAAPQWCALAWLAALVLERHRASPIAAGCAVATTPLALPLLPFVAIDWYRRAVPPDTTSARRELLRFAGLAVLVAAVLIVPWVLWSPHDFTAGVIIWFNDLDAFPRAQWRQSGAWAGQPGLAGVFWLHGFERALKPLQLVMLAGLVGIYARRTLRSPSRNALAPFLVAAMLLFLALNPVVWSYFWETALVVALVAAASSGSTREQTIGAAEHPVRAAE